MSSILMSLLYCYSDHRDLHSFPTRRSSDLVASEKMTLSVRELKVALPDGRVLIDGVDLDKIGRATSELQSLAYLVCRLLLEKKNKFCTMKKHSCALVSSRFKTPKDGFINTV